MPWLLAGGAGVLALAAGLAMGWNQSRPTSSKLPTPPLTPEAREAETSTQEEPAESAAQPQPGQGSLQLSSREPSWLEVRNGEGKELFRGLFTGTGNFSLAEGLQVLAGRPDLITVTTASGESETLGTIEEISWQRFSSSGERDSPQPALSRRHPDRARLRTRTDGGGRAGPGLCRGRFQCHGPGHGRADRRPLRRRAGSAHC